MATPLFSKLIAIVKVSLITHVATFIHALWDTPQEFA